MASQMNMLREDSEFERGKTRDQVAKEREKLSEWCDKVLAGARETQDRDNERIKSLEHRLEQAEYQQELAHRHT